MASKKHNSPCQTVRSVVHLDANRRSPALRALRHTGFILRRESGF